MITVKECRKILKENGYEGIEDMTDGRILELRDFLYHLARIQIEDEEKRGVWKKAKSVKGLQQKDTRLGTYDANLIKIHD